MKRPERAPLRPVWDRKVLGKMDGGLRRLLRMSDVEILAAVNADQHRLRAANRIVKRLYEKLPPSASREEREAADRAESLARAGALPDPVLGPLIIRRLKPVRIRSRAIVRFAGNRDDLTALGLEVRSQAHDIFTVVGTLPQLANLAAQPATLQVRQPRLLLPVVENAAHQGQVDTARQVDAAHPAGLDGQGIIVGIIDGPLDVTHHGFRQAAAPHNSRVLYYWVQTPDNAASPGQTPDAYHTANAGTPDFSNPTALAFGRLYDQAAINTALGQVGGPYGNNANHISCAPRTAEHGTHVAGIAAGSGRGANGAAGTHIGAAPEADIVHVRYWHSVGLSYDATFEDSVIDAMDFIFRVSDHLNAPAVINVSQAVNLGPHNGTTAFDQARDNMLNSFHGRSIVFAAGNNDGDSGFRDGTIAASTDVTLNMTIARQWDPATASWVEYVNLDRYLDVWYSGPELEVEVSSGGQTSGTIAAGSEWDGVLNGFHAYIDRDAETGGGLRNIRVRIAAALSTAAWAVRLNNPNAANAVDYHAWTAPQGHHAGLGGAVTGRHTLSDSGCCQSVLTVGACGKRNPANPAQPETITDYSGAGPTVDGRIKPEIVAVGGTASDIISANSDRADGYVGKMGTSMAAPLVSGAVALMFQAFQALGDDLDQDTIKAVLTHTTNTDNLDPADPGYVAADKDQYGYGRLRLLAGVERTAPLEDIDVWVKTAGGDVGMEPFVGDCFCCAPEIRVFDQNGVETTQLHWGDTYHVHVTVRNLGILDATGTNVQLKYTKPWTAPNTWVDAAPAQTVNVPALGYTDPPVSFDWTPNQAAVGAAAGETHFCLLAEVERLPEDPLSFSAAGAADAWATNIKGTNNVALRNVHIQ